MKASHSTSPPCQLLTIFQLTLLLNRHPFFKLSLFSQLTKAVVRGCSIEKVLLEFSQNSQEKTCARVSFLITYGGILDTPSVNLGLEVATGGVLYENVFLEISQNSQESTCVRASFLIKLQTYGCLKIYH